MKQRSPGSGVRAGEPTGSSCRKDRLQMEFLRERGGDCWGLKVPKLPNKLRAPGFPSVGRLGSEDSESFQSPEKVTLHVENQLCTTCKGLGLPR